MGGLKNRRLNQSLVDAILMEIIDKILSCCNIMVDNQNINSPK